MQLLGMKIPYARYFTLLLLFHLMLFFEETHAVTNKDM